VYPAGYKKSSSGSEAWSARLIFEKPEISPLCIHCLSVVERCLTDKNAPSVGQRSKDGNYPRLLQGQQGSSHWKDRTSSSHSRSPNMGAGCQLEFVTEVEAHKINGLLIFSASRIKFALLQALP